MSALLPITSSILQPNKRRSNVVTTGKYSWWSFLPVTLYQLLHPAKRFANFYFLLVGGLQMVEAISLTNGQPSTWVTLTFLLLIDLVLMAKEDMARHRADRATNGQRVDILSAAKDGPMAPGTWADVRVGDVVRVTDREAFPADLLLLRASDPPGQCWSNTKPLDGESDLKLRVAPKLTAALLEGASRPEELRQWLRGTVKCEAPNDKVSHRWKHAVYLGIESFVLQHRSKLIRCFESVDGLIEVAIRFTCTCDETANNRYDDPIVGALQE